MNGFSMMTVTPSRFNDMTSLVHTQNKKPEVRRIQLAKRVASAYMQGSPRVRVAGEIRFIKDNGPESRTFPRNYGFNPKAKKPLAKVLWSVSVALGHLISAYSTFTKIKAVSISPDGK